MKNITTLLILLLCLLKGVCTASELLKITRVDHRNTIQLFFSFDKPPVFTNMTNKRRIDLIFQATKADQNIDIFAADDKIVKILPQSMNGNFVLSLFFRYNPQHYTLSESGSDTIVLEIMLGNSFSKSFSNLAEKLKGLTILDRSFSDYSNPYMSSPYTKNWLSFFTKYEYPVSIDIQVKFTTPPFPIIQTIYRDKSSGLQSLPHDIIELSDQSLWGQISQLLLKDLESTAESIQRAKLEFTYGEVLFRMGDYKEASKQLKLLK